MNDVVNNTGHTVLIVEDDLNVRDLAVEMFASEGYNVLVASDVKTGKELFAKHPAIDLVFSDLILPGGVTGAELTKWILEEKPNTLVVLATGYQDKGEAIAANTKGLDNVAFIPKPYDVYEVPKIIQAMFDKRS
ncbi:MAG: DNA-binding NtrC family response regulator [Pseudohongiellaceae bacterium]|jgi:DNA-binding NtrC family response regulator